MTEKNLGLFQSQAPSEGLARRPKGKPNQEKIFERIFMKILSHPENVNY